MPHKTTVFFNRNCHDYGAQDKALRQRGGTTTTSGGKCAKNIRRSIEAGFGVKQDSYKAITPVSAKNYGSFLEDKGFQAVNTTVFKQGDIAVFQNYKGGSIHGHIQMFNGKQWVSDFKQNHFWAGKGYRTNKPNYKIFRWE